MVLYAGIVRDGRDHMFFTIDEVALIDGLMQPTLLQIPYQKIFGPDIMKRINTSKTTEPIMRI